MVRYEFQRPVIVSSGETLTLKANQALCTDTIIHGNCMDIMPDLPEKSVDMVLTDIPYGVVSRESAGLRNLDKGDADVETFDLVEFLKELDRLCAGSIYIFCATEQAGTIRGTLTDLGLITRTCVWKKTNPSPMNGQHIWLSGLELCIYGKQSGATFNEFCTNPIWEYPTVRSKRHPTEKPEELCRYLIRTSSNPGDVILDPCCGSGTTPVAAFKEGRRYIGIELKMEYWKVAMDRMDEAKDEKYPTLFDFGEMKVTEVMWAEVSYVRYWKKEPREEHIRPLCQRHIEIIREQGYEFEVLEDDISAECGMCQEEQDE